MVCLFVCLLDVVFLHVFDLSDEIANIYCFFLFEIWSHIRNMKEPKMTACGGAQNFHFCFYVVFDHCNYTIPLKTSYHQFWFLIGEYSVAEI